MDNTEFSNEFDVLYNSITSNQAPGLDEYEKSVFLTKAQDEIIKAYFNPRSNKTQEGFDGSEKRQIDFSMLIKNVNYAPITIKNRDITTGTEVINTMKELYDVIEPDIAYYILPDKYKLNSNAFEIKQGTIEGGSELILSISPFMESSFDIRKNTKSITIEEDILMILNEWADVDRGTSKDIRLLVTPLTYTEYSRLMSKPYKRPIKNIAWRLLDNSTGLRKAEIIVGPEDTITKYSIRYLKRPRAIRLITFDDVTLDGGKEIQECELDPILHPEILQRAVELAKSAYTGDLQSQIVLGQASHTNMGAVQSSK